MFVLRVLYVFILLFAEFVLIYLFVFLWVSSIVCCVKTRQFYLVLTQFSISNFSVIVQYFETEQLQIGNWVETRQNCLVLSAVVFTPPTQTRQFCRRCEHVIRVVAKQAECSSLVAGTVARV